MLSKPEELEEFNKMNIKFKAFVLEKKEKKIKGKIKTLLLKDLMPGNVLVKIAYSTFNYKDGLAIDSKIPIVKKYPMIPGVDFSGTVIESSHRKFTVNDRVLLNGWGVGEKHYGGFSQYARVDGDWLQKIPKKFNERDSMIIGSAGYTSMLCVMKILENIKPKDGKILVTGSTGGVGSIAVNLLSRMNYHVVALTKKNNNTFLKKIGAKEIVNLNNFKIENKPLKSTIWAGAIDTVGGDILAEILKELSYNGVVACTGLAKSAILNTTVFPFILRNISLCGIDSVYAPRKKRVKAWELLEKYIDLSFLKKLYKVYTLKDLNLLSKQILAGKIYGRSLIDVNTN